MPILQTKELGEIEVKEEEIVTFAEGIPGFEHVHRFVWIGLGEQLPIWYMQSIDEPDLRFVVTNPFTFKPNYEFKLENAVKEKLGIESPDDVQVYCLLSIPNEQFEKATMNLLGPIVMNAKKRTAQQVILHGTLYAMKHPLFSVPEEAAGQERNEG